MTLHVTVTLPFSDSIPMTPLCLGLYKLVLNSYVPREMLSIFHKFLVLSYTYHNYIDPGIPNGWLSCNFF
jgi:hypothetical protein